MTNPRFVEYVGFFFFKKKKLCDDSRDVSNVVNLIDVIRNNVTVDNHVLVLSKASTSSIRILKLLLQFKST